jgi:hypothetical protein
MIYCRINPSELDKSTKKTKKKLTFILLLYFWTVVDTLIRYVSSFSMGTQQFGRFNQTEIPMTNVFAAV